jgi:hypothetical protein
MCAVNTDCNNPLSCTFGRCHETCREARDCSGGQRCVTAPGGAVCLTESTCAYRSDCPTPLVCALDRQCRSQCHADIDCATKTQKCVLPDMVCAEPAEIDLAGGKLKSAQPTPVPEFRDAGAAAAADASASDGSLPGDAGSAPDGAVADVAISPPDASAPDVPRDVNLGDVPVGPCGFQDPSESNDTREQATPLFPGGPVPACTGAYADLDWYELVAPATDPAGGYFQIAVTDVGDARLNLATYAASDNTLVLEPFGSSTLGASMFMYFAAAPGQHYRVRVSYAGYDFEFKTPSRYTIKATYTPLPDSYEPNDTRADAKAIPLGTPITAYAVGTFTTGHVSYADGRTGAPATYDWYKVDAAAGKLQATVQNSAGDVGILVILYDALGTERVRMDSTNAGAGASAMLATVSPGTYYILVLATGNGPQSAGPGMAVAPSFTTPYTLTVSQ